MSIKHDVDELQKINAEITRLYKSIKQLREAKITVEKRISEFLEREELPAVKDKTKGIIVKLNKETKRVYATPKKTRDQEAIGILEMAGVKDATDLYSKLRDVGRNSVEKKVLKINKIN
jgi:hypothetical protein